MANKNTKTFADRAKLLIGKYKRAAFDPTEKAELDQKLSELSQEQEMYRKANGIDQDEQMQQGQEMQQFGGGSSLNLDLDQKKYPGIYSQGRDYFTDYSNPLALQDTNNLSLTKPGQYGAATQSNIKLDYPAVGSGITNPSAPGVQAEDNLSPYQTSIVPSLVAGGVSTLGNLFLANQAKKGYSPINLPRASAKNRSLARERSAVKREADESSANVRRNIKSGAKTRGELMGNISASEASMQKNLADSYGRSYQQEEALNAQEAARVQQLNAQMAAQETQYNSQMKNQSLRDQQAYQSAAIGAIPQTMRDIRESQQNDALINSLGDDYGIFKQDYEGRKWYQPKKIVRSHRKKK